MHISLVLDQPHVGVPLQSRRLSFGQGGERVAILNGRADAFEGGGDEPELSLKWLPRGSADYEVGRVRMRLSGATQLLLNRGRPYRLRFREPSETFVLFWSRNLANSAWRSFARSSDSFPEVPTVAGRSHAALQSTLEALRAAANDHSPHDETLHELSLAALSQVAVLAAARRGSLSRVPVLKRARREELLRRVSRAESYLLETQHATLDGAADSAALSPFHLIRVFRSVHGETPLGWAAGKRLESARDALTMTNDSVEKIARCAGYESRNAFDRAFCRRFGQTPGAVRQRPGTTRR